MAEAHLVLQVIQILPRAKAGWDPGVCTGRCVPCYRPVESVPLSLLSSFYKLLFLPIYFFLPKTFLGPSRASRVITESMSLYVVRGLHYSYAPYTHAV